MVMLVGLVAKIARRREQSDHTLSTDKKRPTKRHASIDVLFFFKKNSSIGLFSRQAPLFGVGYGVVRCVAVRVSARGMRRVTQAPPECLCAMTAFAFPRVHRRSSAHRRSLLTPRAPNKAL
nr:hypothetical protein [Pandoravirus massiliensis]